MQSKSRTRQRFTEFWYRRTVSIHILISNFPYFMKQYIALLLYIYLTVHVHILSLHGPQRTTYTSTDFVNISPKLPSSNKPQMSSLPIRATAKSELSDQTTYATCTSLNELSGTNKEYLYTNLSQLRLMLYLLLYGSNDWSPYTSWI